MGLQRPACATFHFISEEQPHGKKYVAEPLPHYSNGIIGRMRSGEARNWRVLRMNAPAYSQRPGLGPQPRSAYVCRISIIIRPKADGTNGCRRVTTLSGHRASRCNSRPGTQSPIYANLFFVWDQTGRLEDPRYVANAVHLFLNMLSYQSPQSCIQTLAPNASLRFETLPKERRLPFACYCFARAG